jgi:hypothetical protein
MKPFNIRHYEEGQFSSPEKQGCQMGIFSNPKSQFGSILEGLAMEVAYL